MDGHRALLTVGPNQVVFAKCPGQGFSNDLRVLEQIRAPGGALGTACLSSGLFCGSGMLYAALRLVMPLSPSPLPHAWGPLRKPGSP